MKKCPTCEKTFDDSMKFCQVDGTPLVDEEPAFDPYATMVSTPAASLIPDEAKSEADSGPEHLTVGSVPIAPPDDVLDLPEADPLKTMYASTAEMKEILGDGDAQGNEIVDVPPIGDALPEPEPPSFSEPELPAPTFGASSPPPSPFSAPESNFAEPAPAPPVFEEPKPVLFEEAETVMGDQFEKSFKTEAAGEWSPPPAPVANWQEQPIGSNTPFQPPVASSGPSSALAIVSLILGIFGLLFLIPTLIFTLCGILSFLLGLAAAIVGFLARSRANSSPDQYGGKGLATGGIILGVIDIIAPFALVALMFLFWGGMAALGSMS